MLYINDTVNNIHKLIALPYRYVHYPISNPHIYILDCDHGDDSTAIIWNSFHVASASLIASCASNSILKYLQFSF